MGFGVSSRIAIASFRTNQQFDESEGSLGLAIIGKHAPIIRKSSLQTSYLVSAA
jgi:hypothetical protein